MSDKERFAATKDDVRPLGKTRIVNNLTPEQEADNKKHEEKVSSAFDKKPNKR